MTDNVSKAIGVMVGVAVWWGLAWLYRPPPPELGSVRPRR